MKTKVVAFRLTEDDYAVLHFLAERSGCTMSSIVEGHVKHQLEYGRRAYKLHLGKVRAKAACEKAAAEVVPDGNA